MIKGLPSAMPLLRALAGAVLLALAADGTASAAANAPDPSYGGADYRLGSGDKVRVTVFGESDLSGEFQVDATGNVRLPMIGQVQAGGQTAHALEGNITAALQQGYLNEPRVNVEVTVYRPFFIVGEVLKPGEYPYANGMTASTAVAVAGGFTPRAVQSTIYVRHQGENAEHQVSASDAIAIYPGDVVRVDSTAFWDVMDVLSPLAGGATALRYTIP